MTTKHTNLTAEQIERTKNVARTAANRELRGDTAHHNADWWVAEYSYDLGIVDARGMIDLTGEIARLFTRERLERLRALR